MSDLFRQKHSQRKRGGCDMNSIEQLFRAVATAVDTLPDYRADGLSDDEVCDVVWVKSYLADALALAVAEDREEAA